MASDKLFLKICCFALEPCHGYNFEISELSKIRKGARITKPVKVSKGIRPDSQLMNVQLAEGFQFIPFAVTVPKIIRGFFPHIIDDGGCLL